MYEVYLNSSNTELIIEDLKDNETKTLLQMGLLFIKKADKAIKEQYTVTYKELVKDHGASDEMTYARVRHFFSCNFSVKDGNPDIDEDFNFILENIPCPLKIISICKHKICEPEIVHELSDRETQVLRPFANGCSLDEISEQLFISTATIHNHINNMYRKIGVAGKPNPDRKLVAYAHKKRII